MPIISNWFWLLKMQVSLKHVWKHRNVLYMLTSDTFAHDQNTSTFAFHCLVGAKQLLLINTILAPTKQWNTEYAMRKYASGNRIYNFSDLCLKTYCSHIALLHILEPYLLLCGEHANSEMPMWLVFVDRNLVPPRVFVYNDVYKHQARLMWVFYIIVLIMNIGR